MLAPATGSIVGRVRAVLGFSRFLQASLSVAQPVIGMLLAAQGVPSLPRLLLAISACWAGFLAVFALNDLLDVPLDRARFAHLRGYEGFDIDSALARHPLAQGQVSFTFGAAWIACLGLFALLATYLLHPVAALLFAAAVLLEAIYCRLARVTPLKFLVSGIMVGAGAVAGWAAMAIPLRPAAVALLFLWIAAWEIGGRNIVNDFADVEEDERLGVRTVPLAYGPRVAARLDFAFLVATALGGVLLQPLAGLGPAYGLVALASGVYLLLLPGVGLLRRPLPQQAMVVFNRASLYPPVVLGGLILSLLLAR
jgi:4-hydroxybenzoate polyprenyltransferase